MRFCKSVGAASLMIILGAANIHAALVEKGMSDDRGYSILSRHGNPDMTQGSDLPLKNSAKVKQKDDEILVKFRENASEEHKKKLHKQHGAEKLKEFAPLRLHHLKLRKGMGVDEAINLYKTDPDVEYAEPNFLYSTQSQPNDPRFGELWGLKNTGQTGGTAGADIRATDAWGITTGNSDVIVAIIDTGIDYTHPDLAGNIWVNAGIDTANQDSDPFDDNGHGTHVAGTIGATGDNGTGVAGVNWNVKLTACKFLNAGGSGSTDGAIQCLQYIKELKDSGANIVATNNSWGGGGYSQALYDAINAQRDILFIASAGNSCVDTGTLPQYPAGYNLPNIIAVGATDHNDNKASFSNYGKRSVHTSAPGARILSTLPSANEWGIAGGYGMLSGTSMAAPHVTGLAALIKAQNPGRDWIAIKNLILAGGDNAGNMYERTITGKRINALNSLTCVNRTVFSVLQYPTTITVGTPVTLSAMSINCEAPSGPVTVTLSGGELITLLDDGVSPDIVAGDGIYTANWTPVRSLERLVFASPAGTETIEFPPLGLVTKFLPSAPLNSSYRKTVQASGGYFPYTFSMISGALPPGITLNGSTGELSGTPTVPGMNYFTVLVVDRYGAKAVKDFSLNVNPAGVYEAWNRSADTNAWVIHSGGYDAGRKVDVAVDGAGNAYVLGFGYATDAQNVVSLHYYLFKYDASGNEQWSNTSVVGIPNAVAADSAGYVYAGGLGLSSSTSTYYDQYKVAKYDPQGNVVWTRQYAIDAGVVNDLATDSNGNVYITGGGAPGYRTIKYDSAGNMLWVRTTQIPGKYIWSPYIAADGNGNVYITGHTESLADPNIDVVLMKYDASGNLLWSKLFDNGGNEAGQDVAVDSTGNAYVTGWSIGSPSTLFLMKFDQNGNQLWNRPHAAGFGTKGLGLAIDKDNRIFVTGSITGTSYGQTDLLTLIYDSFGTTLSSMVYDGGGTESGEGLKLGPSGDIYIAGSNGGVVTLKYDISPPATTVTPADGTYDVPQTVTLTTNEPATIYYTLDGSPPTSDSPVYSAPLVISAATTLRYFAVDSVGHAEAVKSATYVILPQAIVSGTPASQTSATDATLTISGTNVVAYKYKLDAGGFSAETPVASPISLSSLGEGVHTVSVIGKDGSGYWQAAPTTVSWSVDYTPPLATVSVPLKSASSAAFSVGGADVVAYRYSIDGGSYSAETAVANNIVITSLSEGPHSIEVIGRDSAGNWQTTPTSKNWVVANLPVSIPGGEIFATILEAYAALPGDNILQLKETEITENIIFNRSLMITLRGGYNPSTGIVSGSTTLRGFLEIIAGTVIIENLVLAD